MDDLDDLQHFTRSARVGKLLSDSVGTRLQAIRKIKGLSQRELARRAEVTNSTLSMIEQGKVSPSISSLEKILHAFPMSLQEFFSESLELSPPVFYGEEFALIQQGDVNCHRIGLKNASNEGIFLTHQQFPAGSEIGSDWMTSSGFVGGLVTEGSIELHLEGVEYILQQGDGFHFSLLRDHKFKNSSGADCIIVSVAFSE